jgi:hypothetical protein|uniref:Uncharacterized protein n=1 Tax=viral metagenome TaxID=1070528 RepID=A0A6C0C675_9ZZZZ
MDIINYRKIVVNCPYDSDNINGEPWEQVILSVPNHWSFYHRIDHPPHSKDLLQHPLVNSGKAYWINYNTLCTGYRLRNNPDIFRSIFGTERQRQISKFQNNINRVVKRRKKKLAFIELFKLTRIPLVLVDKIIELVY